MHFLMISVVMAGLLFLPSNANNAQNENEDEVLSKSDITCVGSCAIFHKIDLTVLETDFFMFRNTCIANIALSNCIKSLCSVSAFNLVCNKTCQHFMSQLLQIDRTVPIEVQMEQECSIIINNPTCYYDMFIVQFAPTHNNFKKQLKKDRDAVIQSGSRRCLRIVDASIDFINGRISDADIRAVLLKVPEIINRRLRRSRPLKGPKSSDSCLSC